MSINLNQKYIEKKLVAAYLDENEQSDDKIRVVERSFTSLVEQNKIKESQTRLEKLQQMYD